MKEAAESDRRRERRRRRRWLQQEGLAIRMGAATLFRGPKHRDHASRRSRHHSSHRHRSTPVVAEYPTGAPVVVHTANGHPIQVARSMGNGHHRHHSTSAVPVQLTASRHAEGAIPVSHSRSRSRHHSLSYGGTEVPVTPSAHASAGIPMAPTVHSHREMAIPVQRSTAGHSARQFYEDLGPSHPGTARTSSSRHRSMSGSYHGRHRTHTSNTPSIIHVSA